MPSLKDLKVRIGSVKSTRKITSAMKMVAAAKLRRAQENAERARPYAERMDRVLASLAAGAGTGEGAPKLLAGTGSDNTHLLIPCTADRGLCGGFNGSIVRQTRTMARDLKGQGKTVKLFCIGKKSRDLLKGEFAGDIVETVTDIGRRNVEFGEARAAAERITEMFGAGDFDICTIIFNRFQSAMTQVVTASQLIPFQPAAAEDESAKSAEDTAPDTSGAVHIFEPDETEILADLLPRNTAVQVFQALLESAASEHGARMTAMDNATRNAGDMIDGLTLTYNRARQAAITKELIEIISGAEAL